MLTLSNVRSVRRRAGLAVVTGAATLLTALSGVAPAAVADEALPPLLEPISCVDPTLVYGQQIEGQSQEVTLSGLDTLGGTFEAWMTLDHYFPYGDYYSTLRCTFQAESDAARISFPVKNPESNWHLTLYVVPAGVPAGWVYGPATVDKTGTAWHTAQWSVDIGQVWQNQAQVQFTAAGVPTSPRVDYGLQYWTDVEDAWVTHQTPSLGRAKNGTVTLRFTPQGSRYRVFLAGPNPDSPTHSGAGSAFTVSPASTHSVGKVTVAKRVLKAGSVKIRGAAILGSEVEAVASGWQPDGDVALRYQWYLDGKKLSGETDRVLEIPRRAEASNRWLQGAGKKLSVQVTGSFNGVKATKTATTTLYYEAVILDSLEVVVTQATGVLRARATTESYGVKMKYQWYRNGAKISGATKATYAPTSSDRGKYLQVRVSPTRSTVRNGAWTWNYYPVAEYSAPLDVSLHAVGAPTIRDAMSGESLAAAPSVGQRLTLDGGDMSYMIRDFEDSGEEYLQAWYELDVTALEYRYQWYRNGAAIAGATQQDYVVSAKDLGKAVSARIEARFPGADKLPLSARATSVKTAKVVKGAIQHELAVDIAASKRKLQAIWSGVTTTGVKASYQWYRNGKAISGATKSTYSLSQSKDAGKTISVRVSISKSGYTTVRHTAARTVTSRLVAAPVITGAAEVGAELAVTAEADPNDSTLRYQWLRDGKAIKGATAATYLLKASDRGKRISVKVSVTHPHLLGSSRTSAQTVRVVTPPPPVE